MQGRQPSPETVLSEKLSLLWKGNKGYINLKEWYGFSCEWTSLAGAEVLGTLHVCEEEF